MSGAARVRDYIQSLTAGLFTRRELVFAVGSRGVVDNELSRLSLKRLIGRVATGVYRVLSRQAQDVSAAEIARIRAESFGKRVLTVDDNGFQEAKTQISTSFFTDGCRTSFNSVHGRIFFNPIAPRRLSSGNSNLKSSGDVSCSVTVRKVDMSPAPAMNRQRVGRNSIVPLRLAWIWRFVSRIQRLLWLLHPH